MNVTKKLRICGSALDTKVNIHPPRTFVTLVPSHLRQKFNE